jgi:hypothetical protein
MINTSTRAAQPFEGGCEIVELYYEDFIRARDTVNSLFNEQTTE